VLKSISDRRDVGPILRGVLEAQTSRAGLEAADLPGKDVPGIIIIP
jgi:hypothetical protein